MSEVFYISKLKACLEARQTVNPQYSLRAFARDLDIDPSSLSKILIGKRLISHDQATIFATALKLSSIDKNLFVESIHRAKPSIDSIKIDPMDNRFVLDDESYFKVIAEWEHYAVLSLFDIQTFKPGAEQISVRLGISLDRSKEVIENLVLSGLLSEEDDGSLSKSHQVVRTNEDTKSRARDASHRETLQIGLKKLEEIDVNRRDFSSSTLSIDMNKINEAKLVIREFRMKMSSLLKEGERDQVYQLAVQFYPLTDLEAEI